MFLFPQQIQGSHEKQNILDKPGYQQDKHKIQNPVIISGCSFLILDWGQFLPSYSG